MVLRQEHIPQSKLTSTLLEILEDRWVGTEAGLDVLARSYLLRKDGIGGYTFFFDELLDLYEA